MKYSPIFVLLLLFFNRSIFGQSADEAALRNVILSETQAFTEMSVAEVGKRFWLLDDQTMELGTTADGTQYVGKTEDIVALTEVPPPGHATFEKTGYRFIINGNMASVTYDQVVVLTGTGDKIYSHELRIFRKIDGIWKIHRSSIHQYSP